ncbi:unnamed protein product, partial [Vitis vinifera]|uniref:Uncharacterized protein n=1 Tax=Vitis vinifera TaxID=29760 RepID=D7U901_VITVI
MRMRVSREDIRWEHNLMIVDCKFTVSSIC